MEDGSADSDPADPVKVGDVEEHSAAAFEIVTVEAPERQREAGEQDVEEEGVGWR